MLFPRYVIQMDVPVLWNIRLSICDGYGGKGLEFVILCPGHLGKQGDVDLGFGQLCPLFRGDVFPLAYKLFLTISLILVNKIH